MAVSEDNLTFVQDDLPELPDTDADFTPALARKIIAKYQEMLRTRPSSITQFSDNELRSELHRRAQEFLGDPHKGVSL